MVIKLKQVMAHLIDKDALVAEIERIKDEEIGIGLNAYEMGEENGKAEMCDKFLSFLDTLEVKEVDFDAEWKRYFEHRGEVATVNVKHLAKHFFELGMLSTITEEDCKLIYHISDELPCMREEDFFKELLRRYKAQKGEEV